MHLYTTIVRMHECMYVSVHKSICFHNGYLDHTEVLIIIRCHYNKKELLILPYLVHNNYITLYMKSTQYMLCSSSRSVLKVYLLLTTQVTYMLVQSQNNKGHGHTKKTCYLHYNGGAWWLRVGLVGFDAFRPEGRRFESHSSRHVRTLGKSFTRCCL